MPRVSSRRLAAALACAPLLLAACSSVNLWPFGSEGAREYSRTPTDATEYQCDGGKRFHVRMLQNGASAWIILPERQFRLDKADAAGAIRYGNGTTTLDLNGAEATLTDGSIVLYGGCKSGVAAEAKK